MPETYWVVKIIQGKRLKTVNGMARGLVLPCPKYVCFYSFYAIIKKKMEIIRMHASQPL